MSFSQQIHVLAISVLAGGCISLSLEQREAAHVVIRTPPESMVFLEHAMILASSLLTHPGLDDDQRDMCHDVINSFTTRH